MLMIKVNNFISISHLLPKLPEKLHASTGHFSVNVCRDKEYLADPKPSKSKCDEYSAAFRMPFSAVPASPTFGLPPLSRAAHLPLQHSKALSAVIY